MCGIVGFTGEHQAAPILLDGLAKLEYRGYDSAGIAVRDGDADVEVIKAKGRLKVLAEKTNDGETVKGTCGIGHTRWATHGEPSENNAHPHKSDDGNVVAVHNGIIENYQELKEDLEKTSLKLVTIEELRQTAEGLTGTPKPIECTDKITCIVEYRDGTVLDVIREIKKQD